MDIHQVLEGRTPAPPTRSAPERRVQRAAMLRDRARDAVLGGGDAQHVGTLVSD